MAPSENFWVKFARRHTSPEVAGNVEQLVVLENELARLRTKADTLRRRGDTLGSQTLRETIDERVARVKELRATLIGE